jgi:hypothetical protein
VERVPRFQQESLCACAFGCCHKSIQCSGTPRRGNRTI